MEKEHVTSLAYKREQPIRIVFDGHTFNFILVAPSAKDNELALIEAQQIYAGATSVLTAASERLKELYRSQERQLLIDAMLEAEKEDFEHQANMTLLDDSVDYEEKRSAKIEALKNSRRTELQQYDKEKITEKLVACEINRRLQIAWNYAMVNALTLYMLTDNDRQRLYETVDTMKETLPSEVLERIYDAVVNLLNNRGDAQVFPDPHISKNWTNMPGDMG